MEFKAFITNLGKYNEGELVGEWVEFPTTEEEMREVYERIGINQRYEEFFIADYSIDITKVSDILGEYENLNCLNYLASRLEELNSSEIKLFESALEAGITGANSCTDLINLTYNLDDLSLYEDMNNDEELGEYYFETCGYDLTNIGNLAYYFDYEKFGRDIRIERGGEFTTWGYLEQWDSSWVTEFNGNLDDIPEEYLL